MGSRGARRIRTPSPTHSPDSDSVVADTGINGDWRARPCGMRESPDGPRSGLRRTLLYRRPNYWRLLSARLPGSPGASSQCLFLSNRCCRRSSEAAGFRPCLRCRPETAPFCPAWRGSQATVERAARLIAEDGALDGEDSTIEMLAARVGVGARHLARLFAKHLGATPSQVAKTARVQRAKRLLDEMGLPMTEIALRSGFHSVRRFNAAFAEVYGRAPTEIRRIRRSGR
jgi:methylphosphotriester-DNA--protein-cysteine methyltransferase